MDATLWKKVSQTVSTQPALWTSKEKELPDTTTNLLRYLITFFENDAVARDSVRIFCGVDGNQFAGWSEVRVASLREIQDTLIQTGGKNCTWQLAITIKDFLQNCFDTIFTLDLDEFRKDSEVDERIAFVQQLSGVGTVFKNHPAPYRPDYSTFNRRKLRVAGDPVLPDVVIAYLRFLWGSAKTPPLDFGSQRLLVRMGLVEKGATKQQLTSAYKEMLGRERPMTKHRALLSLTKLVCTSDPRCSICPLREDCKTGLSAK